MLMLLQHALIFCTEKKFTYNLKTPNDEMLIVIMCWQLNNFFLCVFKYTEWYVCLLCQNFIESILQLLFANLLMLL